MHGLQLHGCLGRLQMEASFCYAKVFPSFCLPLHAGLRSVIFILYKNFLGYWQGFCEAAAWHSTHAKKASANQQLFYMADPCQIFVALPGPFWQASGGSCQTARLHLIACEVFM